MIKLPGTGVVLPARAHHLTVTSTDSIAALPDFWNGRGIGCALPFASMVRQRNVYSPARSPGSSAAQWAFASRIGHVRGWLVASSKLKVFAGNFPSGSASQCSGAGRILNVQGAAHRE